MKTFILSHSYYDEYHPYYFLGPDDASHEDFEKLCGSLLDQAAHKAIILARNNTHIHWVGWKDVIKHLSLLLENHGYQLYTPKEVKFFGSNIIEHSDEGENLSGSVSVMVRNHNKKVKSRIHQIP